MKKPFFQGTALRETFLRPKTLRFERLDNGCYRALAPDGTEVASFGGEGDALFGFEGLSFGVRMRSSGDELTLEDPATGRPVPLAVREEDAFWEGQPS